MIADLEKAVEQTPELIPIVIKVKTKEKTQTLILDAQQCSNLLTKGIKRYMGEGGSDDNPEAKALARMMKMAVKGVLLSFGPMLLKFFLGANHPKPGKHDDIVEWYSDIFGKIGIAQMVKITTNLSGEQDGDSIKITEIGTEPNPGFSSEN